MTRNEIVEQLKDILAIFVNKEEEGDIVDFGEDDILLAGEYQIDSISLVNIIVEIERRFGISIDDEYLTFDFLSTIGDMADFVEEMLIVDNQVEG